MWKKSNIERTILLNLLPTELWFMIYRTEHNMLYERVVQDIKDRVVWIVVDKKSRTFWIANGINAYSVLAVF
jgi:hypothetical protein